MAAIRSLKNSKAPGKESLNAELFKAEPEFAAQVLQQVVTTGDRATLLIVSSKILAKLIIRWISEAVDSDADKSKQVFKNNKDAWTRTSLCTTSSKSALNGRGSCISTTWILKRHSTASTKESLWRILGAYGIPQQIVLIINTFYNNFKCRVGNSESSLV